MIDQPTPITDEMPEEWITELVARLEADGHDIADAHESAVVIRLTPTSRTVLAADDSDRLFVIGWADDGDVHWGLSADGVHVPVLRPLGGDSPSGIAGRVHRVLTTGRPVPRDLRHALPYAAVSEGCVCPVVHPCGGIVPDADCGEHGGRRSPVVEWHWEADCPPASQ
ncbi:hypothetical protein [Streptomyces sp. NPDC058108]|uniref:hypothetical protein n=1 Tax=Streptomyces sp. NPDC058108 TaxID=3346344 RepID=UPI0036E1ED39